MIKSQKSTRRTLKPFLNIVLMVEVHTLVITCRMFLETPLICQKQFQNDIISIIGEMIQRNIVKDCNASGLFFFQYMQRMYVM